MKLEHDFRVDAGLPDTWPLLLDIERIAPCMPGAQLQEVEGDEYRGIVKVKVGPITAQYRGVARVLEADEATRRVVLHAEGRDARGQGNASANIVATLTGDGDGTRVHVDTDLTVTGKVAQFGRGVMADVSAKLMGQFVDCLSTTILGPRTGPGTGPGTAGAGTADTTSGVAPPPTPAATRPEAGPPPSRPGRDASTPPSPKPWTWSGRPAARSPSVWSRCSSPRRSSSAWWSGSSPAERSATCAPAAPTIEYMFDTAGPVLGIDPGLSCCGYGAVPGRRPRAGRGGLRGAAHRTRRAAAGPARHPRGGPRRLPRRDPPLPRWRSSGCCSKPTSAPRFLSVRPVASPGGCRPGRWPSPATAPTR